MSRNEDIIAQNNCTSGKIEKVTKCWWLKVNSKPARLYGLDGALFPYLMTVTYSVNGKKYKKTNKPFYKKKFQKDMQEHC